MQPFFMGVTVVMGLGVLVENSKTRVICLTVGFVASLTALVVTQML